MVPHRVHDHEDDPHEAEDRQEGEEQGEQLRAIDRGRRGWRRGVSIRELAHGPFFLGAHFDEPFVGHQVAAIQELLRDLDSWQIWSARDVDEDLAFGNEARAGVDILDPEPDLALIVGSETHDFTSQSKQTETTKQWTETILQSLLRIEL
jgi:hypothetical protein